MLSVIKQIPNLISSANLLCGCLACVFAGLNQFEASFWTLMLGITFDFFDGMIARLLNVTSDLGVQLDSLADIITSGFTPGIVVYQLFIRSGIKVIDFQLNLFSDKIVFSLAPFALIAFLLPIGAAFRLAKFNIIKSKSSDFFGLPTPANAVFFCSLPLLIEHSSFSFLTPFLISPFVLSFIILLFVFMMNSNWRLFSLKFKYKSNWDYYFFPVILLIFSLFLIYFFQGAAFPCIILLYLFLSATRNWILYQS
tara:strand:- start:3430 stop:4188 length:759 start_codon:yes stop_codon:yes gene_type:complete